MESKPAIDKLGYNILDEISNFLTPFEIVSFFGISQSFHKLWNSRISQKIFKAFPDFALAMEPREKWLLLQIKMTCQNENYPKITKITSDNTIYVLETSFNPQPEIKVFMDGQIHLWKPENSNKKIIRCSSIPDLEYPVQACAYEDGHLALLLQNGIVKHIYNGTEINEFQLQFNYEKISKMFYLPKAEKLIIQYSKKIIFLDNLGNISTKSKLGYIEKYITLPWSKNSFIAIINDNFLYIDDIYGRKLLCNYTGPTLKRVPDIWAEEESKKYVLHTGKTNSGWTKKANPNWIDFVEKGTKMFKANGHIYIFTDRNILIDECCNHQYKITQDLENVFADNSYILAHSISPQNNHLIQLFITGETNHIALKWLSNNIKILNFAFPYIVYTSSSKEESEVGILKF